MNKQIIGMLTLLLTFMSTTSIAQVGEVNGDAEVGAQLYFEHGCHGCHGFSGYGRKDLNNTGSPWLTNEEIFRAFLRARADIAPLLPSTDMPNYPVNSLSDEMVKNIYAYVRSMPENTPDTADIPTLNTILEAAAEREYKP